MSPLDSKTWFVEHHSVIDSTQTRCKTLAKEHPYVCVTANEQRSGRGRIGRSFYSPPGGLYFSFAFPYTQGELPLYTPYAAWILREIIAQHYGRHCAIKWVNDLYYDGKKIAGILTEAVRTPHGQTLVIGIGVNLSEPQMWPEEIRMRAGSLGVDAVDGHLVDAFLQAFFERIDALYDARFLKDYEEALLGLGGMAKTSSGIEGRIIGITNLAALCIETESGIEEVSSGEVSLTEWEK